MNALRMLALSLTLLGACAGPDEADVGSPMSLRGRCEASVTSLEPTPGGPVGAWRATFSAPVPSSAWSLEIGGVDAESTLADDHLSATLVPVEPLPAGLAYTVLAEACGTRLGASFEVAPAPVGTDALRGRAWTLRADALAWTDPQLAGWLSERVPSGPAWRVEVVDDSQGPRARLAALSPGDEQGAFCEPAFEVALDLRDDPLLSWELPDRGPLREARVEGWAADGARLLRGVVLTGLLDLREVGVDPAAFCGLAAAAATPCVPCPDGAPACALVGAQLPDALPAGSEPACEAD